MHWRGRQIFSQPRHPDLNVDLCLQRFLHPICFCGGRIPLVLEVRVEEEACLYKITVSTDYPLNQGLGPFSLWLCHRSQEGGGYSTWAGQKAPVCNYKDPLQKGRMCCLPGSGWMVLTVFWVRWHHLELCLTWFPSASVLWFLVCLLSSSICREKSSLQQGLETINKNSNLKCWSSPLGEAQWWEDEELLAGVICSAGRILECNHIVQQA